MDQIEYWRTLEEQKDDPEKAIELDVLKMQVQCKISLEFPEDIKDEIARRQKEQEQSAFPLSVLPIQWMVLLEHMGFTIDFNMRITKLPDMREPHLEVTI